MPLFLKRCTLLTTLLLYCMIATSAFCDSRAFVAAAPSSDKTAAAAYDKLRAEADTNRATADKSRVDASHAEQNAVATYDKLRAEADTNRATADKVRFDANAASVTQWTSIVTAVVTALLTLLAIIVVTVASPRIIDAARNGAIIISIPLIGSISLAQRNAAEQQKTTSPPSIEPEPIARNMDPTARQLAAVAALTGHIIDQSPADVVTVVQSSPSLLRVTLPEIAGITQATDTYFRAFFQNLFLSQYRLLKEIVSRGAVDITDVHALYASARRFGLKALSFTDWVNYLIKYGMVESDPHNAKAPLVATDRGKDFLTWSELTNHGEAQIRAANLSI